MILGECPYCFNWSEIDLSIYDDLICISDISYGLSCGYCDGRVMITNIDIVECQDFDYVQSKNDF